MSFRALLAVLLSIFALGAIASASACQVREMSFVSQVLPAGPSGPKVERYVVVLPTGFRGNLSYGVVYFLHGKTRDRHMITDLGICARLDDYVSRGGNPFVVIAPDGEDSYWMNGALTHQRWGDMVTRELVADAEKKFPLIRDPAGRLLAGISMGGHGAFQLALNHPGIYGAVGGHSPVFRTEAEAAKTNYYEFGSGLDYLNRDPFSLIVRLGKRLSVPVTIDMGGQDEDIVRTADFAKLLVASGVKVSNHVGEDRSGGHADAYWAFHLGDYVKWYGAHLAIVQDRTRR